jgi:maltose O-acetyltransferase
MINKIIKKFILINNIYLKKIYYLLKSKINKKDLKIGSKVKFYQKTIFSGKGSVIIKDKVSIGYKLGGNYYNGVSEFQARYEKSKIFIDNNTAFNNNIFICSANKVMIGKNCRIGEGVTIFDFEAHGTEYNKRNELGKIDKVIIKDNVWIGSKVIILKGTEIGENSIIAAGSVVIGGKFPDNVIIGGNPAKIIKKI